ncbi:MAG: 6,7-dimethyl-8-ribityllumazine synthase [Actinomycetota bacterium]
MTQVRDIGVHVEDAAGLHIGIVVAGWNRSITDRLLEGALQRLERLGVGDVTVLRVPGSLELGVGADALARDGCDAVVALGTVVKGETDHYQIVSTESARALTLVAQAHHIPVTNGVLAVHDVSDAVERSRVGRNNKGDEAATAAVETALALAALEGSSPA